MTDIGKLNKKPEKNLLNNAEYSLPLYSASGVYVREDDQDWGSSGMNNIVLEEDTKQ